jgi:hypothetical protein
MRSENFHDFRVREYGKLYALTCGNRNVSAGQPMNRFGNMLLRKFITAALIAVAAAIGNSTPAHTDNTTFTNVINHSHAAAAVLPARH